MLDTQVSNITVHQIGTTRIVDTLPNRSKPRIVLEPFCGQACAEAKGGKVLESQICEANAAMKHMMGRAPLNK